jgi:plastocyanin
MSILGRKVSLKLVAAMAGLMLLAALLPARSSTPTREITLVVRGMAFYIDGDLSTPNPTLEVKAGERVRVVLRNQDRGMTHDFAVPVVAAATNIVDWDESGDVTFDVRDTPGTYEYVCRPHRLMMRGTIRVH